MMEPEENDPQPQIGFDYAIMAIATAMSKAPVDAIPDDELFVFLAHVCAATLNDLPAEVRMEFVGLGGFDGLAEIMGFGNDEDEAVHQGFGA